MSKLDYLAHASNLMMLVSYSVKDILWLRWFAVAASIAIIPYYLLQSTTLWPPVVWACVFTAINLYQIVLLYLQRRPVKLNAEEQTLYDLSFSPLNLREFVDLVSLGTWHSADHDEQIIAEGAPASVIAIAISGDVTIAHSKQVIGTIEPGLVVGTALALTGNPSPVAAIAQPGARFIQWNATELRTFVDKRPELRTALSSLVNAELARKVARLISYRAGA